VDFYSANLLCAMMSSLEKLGQNIRRLRLTKSLSQEQFALIAEMDRSYIGQIERGVRNIAFFNIVKIARALDVTPAQLMDGIE